MLIANLLYTIDMRLIALYNLIIITNIDLTLYFDIIL